MQAVILAAGKGTRLQPITDTRSKAMLPILGRPIVERIIENLAVSGIRDFILVVNPEDQAIREYFQRRSALEINIRFVHQDRRLGTADALKQAAPYIREDFVLSACDILVSTDDLQRLTTTWFQSPLSGGLLSLERIAWRDTPTTGIVTLEGERVIGIIEKPVPDLAPTNISSTPLYCFSTRILDRLALVPLSPREEYELQDAIQMMIDAGEQVHGMFLQSRLNLTNPRDLLEINLHYLKNRAEVFQVQALEVGPGTKLLQPVCIEKGVLIGAGCQIGPNVYIEKDARIGDNVHLENAVVLQSAECLAGVNLADQLVV
jgi:NDP-sugar pyrophosphorylase family protein